MTSNPPARTLTDPESLRADESVDVRDEVHAVDAADLANARELDSHVVVGVTATRGVLLQNDGHHGWTLPAFPVADGEDWYAVARREFEALTGTAISVDGPERLRTREYRLEEGAERELVRDLVVGATPSEDIPAAVESRVDGTELQWVGAVPEGAPGPVADDISLFVASAGADGPQ